jgi:hypothetical protein
MINLIEAIVFFDEMKKNSNVIYKYRCTRRKPLEKKLILFMKIDNTLAKNDGGVRKFYLNNLSNFDLIG